MSDTKKCDDHVLHKSRRKVLKGLAAGIGLIAMPGKRRIGLGMGGVLPETFSRAFQG